MISVSIDNSRDVQLVMSRQEFDMILGCVMAAIDEVPDWEFSSRLPGDKDAARKLRESLWIIDEHLKA